MIGVWQVFGMMVAGVGAGIALWRILTFVFLGKGTPAPFDPPRRLVVRGRDGRPVPSCARFSDLGHDEIDLAPYAFRQNTSADRPGHVLMTR